MDTTLFAVSALLLTLLALGVSGVLAIRLWAKPLFETVLERSQSAFRSEIGARLEELERDVERLPRVWEEFADDARKTQQRAQWHIKRVKKELQERGLQDEEIDTLGSSLRPVDGNGSGESQLQLLQDPVAEVLEVPEESWMARALRRKYGNG
jgi:hypothetical protein